MKRPRLDEGPDRRIQSEWERLKEYENELLRKELALRDREREGLSAPPLNAQMANGWGHSDPSTARLVFSCRAEGQNYDELNLAYAFRQNRV